MVIIGRILLILWQLPQSILFGILLFMNRNRIDWKNSGWLTPYVFLLVGEDMLIPKVRDGISLGIGIFVDYRDPSDANRLQFSPAMRQVVEHEYGHVWQSRMSAWLYLFTFGFLSILGACVWRVFHLVSAWYYKWLPWERFADFLGGVKR